MRGVCLLLVAIGLGLGMAPSSAWAIDSPAKGRSAEQLFKTNCTICHKSARGLGAATGSWSLSRFLTEHYTTSKSAAGALAGYLQSVNKERPAQPARRRRGRPSKR